MILAYTSLALRSQGIMKVIVAIILVVGSVSGRGSGPYLPSGWRPQGPAFYLPGELQRLADDPPKEAAIVETEASGSDALQEYGPPKIQEVLQNTIQGLPDVATEQVFFTIGESAGSSGQLNAEQKAEIEQELTTEAQLAEEKTTERIESIADIQLQQDTSATLYQAEIKEETQATSAPVEINEELQATGAVNEETADIQATTASEVSAEIQAIVTSAEVKEEVAVEKLEQIVEEEEKAVEEVKNVAETLINLEKGIKAEVKINEDGFGSLQAPEGFLEYGPPGFREYGPPNRDQLLRSAAILESDAASIENNDLRKRRFSPKFRAPKNKRLH